MIAISSVASPVARRTLVTIDGNMKDFKPITAGVKRAYPFVDDHHENKKPASGASGFSVGNHHHYHRSNQYQSNHSEVQSQDSTTHSSSIDPQFENIQHVSKDDHHPNLKVEQVKSVSTTEERPLLTGHQNHYHHHHQNQNQNQHYSQTKSSSAASIDVSGTLSNQHTSNDSKPTLLAAASGIDPTTTTTTTTVSDQCGNGQAPPQSFPFYKFNTSVIERSVPALSTDMIKLYHLDHLAKTMERFDSVTLEKKNKLRKSYVGKIKDLDIPGKNQAVETIDFMTQVMTIPDENWNQMVFGPSNFAQWKLDARDTSRRLALAVTGSPPK